MTALFGPLAHRAGRSCLPHSFADGKARLLTRSSRQERAIPDARGPCGRGGSVVTVIANRQVRPP